MSWRHKFNFDGREREGVSGREDEKEREKGREWLVAKFVERNCSWKEIKFNGKTILHEKLKLFG